MEHRTWTFLMNPFLDAARKSRTRAIKISTWTDGALFERQADAFFGPLYLYYHPLHLALMQEDAEWLSQKGTQKGATQTVDELFDDLSPKKITEWDRMVDNIFNRGTPEYTAVFPQGHKLFQTGSKDERISAVQALSETLGAPTAPPGFAPIKTDVDSFLGQLLGKRATQTGEISRTATESDETTVASAAAMTGLYKILGKCIDQFSDNPTSIEPIFDLQTIRNFQQTEFTGTVAVSSTKNIAKRTLPPDVRMRIKVLTSQPLTFWFADEKNDPVGAVSFTVQGLEEEEVSSSQLGNVPAATYLKVLNTSALVEGQFEVEIL
ncbi:MAG TPA: hypothetical protein VI757_16375 [Bacteroidia bacterium]|nr:hypothetical protein [Bacteroidia bacterium]